MIKVESGVWLPDGEQDQVMISGGQSYQGSKFMAALKYVKHSRLAIDAGAHCGLWSVQLGKYFERVECFEPVKQHIECWRKNAGWKLSCHLHEVALGAKDGTTGMRAVEKLSGRSHIDPTGEPVKMNRLDDYNFENVDFIKVDVEGYEYFVLKGAEQTLLKWKPVVVVEQKPQHGGMARFGVSDTAAVDYLKSLGAVERECIVGDYIMSWEAPPSVAA